MTEKPKLPIFIPVHKNYVYLKHMLETLSSSLRELEFILVNNGSDDDTNKYCRIAQRRKNHTLYHYDEALGVAKVWNICLDIALEKGYEQIIITNSDILFHETCIDHLVKFMEQNPNEILSCPMNICKVMEVVERYPFLKEDSMNQFKYNADGMQNLKDILKSISLTVSEPVTIEQLVDYSCFILRPKKLVEEIGYFDENFLPAYWEDTDMHWRLSSKGIITKTVLNAPMLHIQSRSLVEGGFRNDSYLPNGFYFSKKHDIPFRSDQLIKNQAGQVISLKTFEAQAAYRALENEPDKRVFDCFIFNGDLDALEVKLEALSDYVHNFVVVEAPFDLDGNPKPLYLKDNKDRFAKYLPKMKRLILQDFKTATTPEERNMMLYRSLANGLKEARFTDNIIISSENSLWDIRKVQEFQRMKGVKILSQRELAGFSNVAMGPHIQYSKVLTHKTLVDDFNGDVSHAASSPGFVVTNAGYFITKSDFKTTLDLLERGEASLIEFNHHHIPKFWKAPRRELVFKKITHTGYSFSESTLDKK